MAASIIKDYAEFSGQSESEIVDKVMNFKEFTMEDFNNSDSQFDFYHTSKTYIYDLLGAHPDMDGPIKKINMFLPGVLDYIKQHPGNKFLEFGGGIGDICQTVASWGKDVTYVDIASHITDFALWRFKKYNVELNVQIIPQESFELLDTYDFIYQDAVLEHLTPAQQTSYTAQLARHLNEDGVFVMIVDLVGESEDMPMHFNVDIVQVHNELDKEGLTCYYGRNQFASVWMKHTENKGSEKMREYNSVDGWFSECDVRDYRAIASKYPGGNFVEIGCWKGRSLSSVMPELLNSGYQKIYAVDHWLGSENERSGPHLEATQHDIFPIFKQNLAECGFDGKYIPVRMPSLEAAPHFQNEFFDVVFIDANHTYEEVRKDVLAWLPKVKKGGTLCGHDGSDPNVVRALNETLGDKWSLVGTEGGTTAMVWSHTK